MQNAQPSSADARRGHILSLSLGAETGIAIGGNGAMLSATMRLKPRRGAALDPARLLARLEELANVAGVGCLAIVKQKARRGANKDRRAVPDPIADAVDQWASARRLPVEHISAGEAAKAWTGNGNVSAETLFAEAFRRGFDPLHLPEAWALAGFHYVLAREQDDEPGRLAHW